jgi:hypothetical protein
MSDDEKSSGNLKQKTQKCMLQNELQTIKPSISSPLFEPPPMNATFATIADHNVLNYLSFPYLVSLCVFMYLAQQFEQGRCPSQRVFLARQRSQEAQSGVIPSSSWFFDSSTSVPRFMLACTLVSVDGCEMFSRKKETTIQGESSKFLVRQ